jgi:hypothetical protein
MVAFKEGNWNVHRLDNCCIFAGYNRPVVLIQEDPISQMCLPLAALLLPIHKIRNLNIGEEVLSR